MLSVVRAGLMSLAVTSLIQVNLMTVVAAKSITL